MTTSYVTDCKISWGSYEAVGFSPEEEITIKQEPYFTIKDLSEYDINHVDYSDNLVLVEGYCDNIKNHYSFKLHKESDSYRLISEGKDEVTKLSIGVINDNA